MKGDSFLGNISSCPYICWKHIAPKSTSLFHAPLQPLHITLFTLFCKGLVSHTVCRMYTLRSVNTLAGFGQIYQATEQGGPYLRLQGATLRTGDGN